MEESEIHLFDYVRVVYRRKWLILAIMAMTMALAVYRVQNAVPLYRTFCTLRVEERINATIRSGEFIQYTDHWASDKNLNTHIHVMLNDPVLEQVVKSLDLRTASGSFIRPGALKGYFSIKAVEDTNLIQITATHPDPKMAQDLANTLASSYRSFTIQERVKSSQSNVEWLTEEITKLRAKMEEADQNLYDYKQESHILSLENETRMHAEELSQLRSAHNQARLRRIEIEAQMEELRRISKSEKKYVPAFIEGDLLPTLNSQYVAVKLETANLLKKYGPKHPRIVAAQSALESIQAELNQNIEKEIKSLQSEHAVLRAKERALERSIEQYTEKAMETEQKQIQYALLDKETQLNKELYNILVAKLKEINITEGLEKPEIAIAEAAWIPTAPISSDRNKTLAMSAVIGLVLSFGLAFFMEYLDAGLSTREDVEKYLDLPVLGVIPQTRT